MKAILMGSVVGNDCLGNGERLQPAKRLVGEAHLRHGGSK